jgi:hypothetical protein
MSFTMGSFVRFRQRIVGCEQILKSAFCLGVRSVGHLVTLEPKRDLRRSSASARLTPLVEA